MVRDLLSIPVMLVYRASESLLAWLAPDPEPDWEEVTIVTLEAVGSTGGPLD